MSIVQKHKTEAVLSPGIAPRKVFSNILAEVTSSGGGVVNMSQKSLASNINCKRAMQGGLPKPLKVI